MSNNSKKKIEIHNKISPIFQQINVDGAHGGITPQGKINLNFFAERFPIPKSTVFEVENNKICSKISDSEDSKKGIIREYHFGVYMNLETARGLSLWLQERINQLDMIIKGKQNGTDTSKQ